MTAVAKIVNAVEVNDASVVRAALAAAGRADGIAAVQRLSRGIHADVWLISCPAVSYAWAETDLSMLWTCPRPPASERFFELYQDLSPSPPGWTDRMPILHLRELLSTVAHFGTEAGSIVRQIRHVLAPFS